MGAASEKESPTPSQTLLASLALMRRSLRLCGLASPTPPFCSFSSSSSSFSRRARSLVRSRSLARWAGPGRAPRSRPLPVYVSCKSPRSRPARLCHRPLATGAPRLLPRALSPPPAPGVLPGPARLRALGLPPTPDVPTHPPPTAPHQALPRGRPDAATGLAGLERAVPSSGQARSGNGLEEEVEGNNRPQRPQALEAPSSVTVAGWTGLRLRARELPSDPVGTRGWRPCG